MEELILHKLGFVFKLKHIFSKNQLRGICVPSANIDYCVETLSDRKIIVFNLEKEYVKYLKSSTKNSIKKFEEDGDIALKSYIRPLQKSFVNYMRKQNPKEKIYLVCSSISLLNYLGIKKKNISVFQVVNSDTLRDEEKEQFLNFTKIPYPHFIFDGSNEELKSALTISISKN